MKILLVYPNTGISSDGFRLIIALLRRDGHQLQIVTIPNHPSSDVADNDLRLLGEFSMESDLVILSVYSIHEYHASRYTKYLKEIRPERPVIWGGPHCIGAPEKSLKFADGVCFSEGDIAVPRFVRLFEAGDPAYLQTPNMAFRSNGSFHVNPLLPLVEDLDSLPFYDYSFENEWVLNKSLIPVTKEVFAKYSSRHPFRVPTVSFLSSRGCPHHCSYCNNIRYLKLYPEIKLRRQSIKRLMAEVEYTIGQLPNIKFIFISDDDFFARPEHELYEFVSLYKKNINLPCSLCMSANTYTKDKLNQVMKLEHVVIQLGVQSGSQRVLDNVYDRPIPIIKIKKVIDEISPFLKKGNLKLLCDFIIDNPYETRDDIIKTYKFIAHLNRRIYIEFFLLSFFPGSPIYERALRDKYISIDDLFLSRDYRFREIIYQVNYPMLLILIWESLYFSRRLPLWLIMLPASAPVRVLMRCVPRPIMAWALRKIPAFVRNMVSKFLAKNKKIRERQQSISLRAE